jgi:hypothetical protein
VPPEDAVDDPDRGRLAGAVVAEQGKRLPACHLEGEVVDGNDIVEATNEGVDPDRRLRQGCGFRTW